MAYVRYNGENNVYDTSSGRIVTYAEAQAKNLFAPGIIQNVQAANPYAAKPVTESSFSGQTLTPYERSQINPKPTGTITSTDLTQQPEFALQPLPYETAASNLIKQTQDLYDQLVGKSSYQTKQESKYGIPGLENTITDLTSQLQGIANEAAAIPVQEQSRAAQGTVLTAGLQADQNQQLRDNAVKALGVSTLLAAAQGNLTTAQNLADRAVAAKYDPILEQIDVNKANLDLILNDPLSTLAEKNRAQAQKDAQDAKAEQVQNDKDQADEIYKIAIDAAQNGASATVLQQIQQATTKEEALRIATEAGVYKPKPTGNGNEPPVDFATAATNLQNQRIPSTTLNKDATISLAVKRKLLDAGFDDASIDWLWNEIIGGTSFEDIRAALRNNKDDNGQPAPIDTAVLDTFVQLLQEQ